jgi:transcription termination factor Rho
MKDNKIFEGYLNISRGHTPTLWTIPFDNNQPNYPFPSEFIRKFNLNSGARVKVAIVQNKIASIISICDLQPEAFAKRKSFNHLTPVNPNERFDFSNASSTTLRILDLFTPIGKGTRGLIVSPPRAGKTILLEAIAKEMIQMNSKLRVIILLIDERPEEVTSFVLNTNAPVFHSSLDKGTSSHVLLSGFLINHLIAEMECGNDTVILLDSLTRMGRAYNAGKNNNRTMSGGLSSGALEIPRKLFGLARNIQNGGSCTILATILKDTGSRMDEVIFQEFKGTGNCEIILDREIAEERLYPALHLSESGTRKDELLHSEEEIIKINKLRRSLLQMDKFSALVKFIEMVESTESNTELLNQL